MTRRRITIALVGIVVLIGAVNGASWLGGHLVRVLPAPHAFV